MSRYLIVVASLAISACTKAEPPVAETAAPVAHAPAPAVLDITTLTGTWRQVVRGETGDSILTTSELNVGPDANSWTVTLPGRPPQHLKLTVAGDSIVTVNGPNASVLREGVQVTTTGVMRLVDGKLVGRTVARYSGPGVGADSLRILRSEATRVP